MAPPLNGDMENGDVEKEGRRDTMADDGADLGEYGNLVKYISNFRDGRRASVAGTSVYEEEPKKKWFQFGKKKGGSDDSFDTPDEWLGTDWKQGLTTHDIEQRRRKTGYNELTTEKENMFLKFLSYFTGPILYVMELAVLLAAGLRDWIDFGVIIGILMLNAIVGWYQEKQAADVVASLKGDIALRTTVIRNGAEEEIKARELVPGDIVIIEDGSVVPADCRIISAYDNPNGYADYQRELEAQAGESEKEKGEDEEEGEKHGSGFALLAIDQSAMTGESLAVDKYVADVIYYTTGCKRGKAYAIVTHSAKMSFVGRTASLVSGAKDQGHFKAIMNSIGTALLVLVVGWILIAWIGGFFHYIHIATPENSSINLLHYALILLIVGVPVGLPVVTTTTLAVGAAYLAKEKAIVQKLTAIESLAGVDVLCSDKTGTLTANQLSIREPFVAEGIDVNWMMAVAALASSHNVKSLDPIDKVTILTLKRYPRAK